VASSILFPRNHYFIMSKALRRKYGEDLWSKADGPYLHGHHQAFMRKKGLSKGWFAPEVGATHMLPKYMHWDIRDRNAHRFNTKQLRYFAARTGRLGFYDSNGSPSRLYRYPRKNHIDRDFIHYWEADEYERQQSLENASTLNEFSDADDEATVWWPAHVEGYLEDLERNRRRTFRIDREIYLRELARHGQGGHVLADAAPRLDKWANLVKHAVAAVAARNIERKMSFEKKKKVTFADVFRNRDALTDGAFQMRNLLDAAPGGDIQINGRALPPNIQDSVVSFLMPSPSDLT